MAKKNVQPPQSSVILRILGGGYLVYLAYDLIRGGALSDPLLTAAVAVFALVGGVLLFFSIRHLVNHEYFYDKKEEENEEEEPEEPEET